MRSEQEILELILDIAKGDERIRAVILNGSRANPKAPRDIFQDFDVVYIVTDVLPFKRNPVWIERFGELMIMQMPDDMGDLFPSEDGSFAYLMQFTDGIRIDLTIYPLAKINGMPRDSLSMLLLDKDGIIAPFPPASESDYLPQKPTAKEFADCCNEFWWVCTYVAKGLWRDEIIYAKSMLDQVVRVQVMQMLTWSIGMKTQFSSNPGYLGKHFEQYLESDLWDLLLDTYADASIENTWNALFMMCDLFRKVAIPIAEQFGYDYPLEDDNKVRAHLEHVRNLPSNVEEMY